MSNLQYNSIEEAYNKGVAYYKMIDGSFGKEQLLSHALEYLNVAANAGHSSAKYYLGLIYNDEYGQHGIRKDAAKAVQYFKVAAEQGVVDAQNEYAQALLHGDGIQENKNEYIYWLTKAADNGNIKAMFDMAQQLIGIMAERDQVMIPVNYRLAIHYLRKVAISDGYWQGFAQGLLGIAYVEGWGVSANDREALSFFLKALKNPGHHDPQDVFYVYRFLKTGSFPSMDEFSDEEYEECRNLRLKEALIDHLQRLGI